jgi:hypothetical protein
MVSWSTLRAAGNSSYVRISAIFPIVGYFILFNEQVKQFIDAHGLSYPQFDIGALNYLWSAKLYFLYYGFMFAGTGALIYQWRCPAEIRKHSDWKDYIAKDGDVLSHKYLRQLGEQIGINYQPHLRDSESVGSEVMQTWYELQDRTRPISRFCVLLFFTTSGALLAVPSSLTAIKVALKFVSSP